MGNDATGRSRSQKKANISHDSLLLTCPSIQTADEILAMHFMLTYATKVRGPQCAYTIERANLYLSVTLCSLLCRDGKEHVSP